MQTTVYTLLLSDSLAYNTDQTEQKTGKSLQLQKTTTQQQPRQFRFTKACHNLFKQNWLTIIAQSHTATGLIELHSQASVYSRAPSTTEHCLIYHTHKCSLNGEKTQQTFAAPSALAIHQ